MIRSFAYGLLAYGASAAIFVVFSIFFVRTEGADTYGSFSLLLNTVSALTLFGNYHGALVAYAPASQRRAFRAMFRPVFLYAVGAAVISAAVLSAIGNLPSSLLAPIGIAFMFIVVSGLPTSAKLASAANWIVNIARAIYQSLFILAFWALFSLGMDLGTAFALALLLGSAIYLAILAYRADPPDIPVAGAPAPRLILLLALCWNVAQMGVIMTDKFAIRFLNVGVDSADVGVFLLYLDIAGRFSAIYAIGLAPLTYELLRRLRDGTRVGRVAAAALGVCLCVGVVVSAAGYFVIPPLYVIDLAGREWLPGVIGVYVALLGFGSVFLAYCNSAGRPVLLLRHYAGVFAISAAALLAIYLANGRHISITFLAVALALGQCFVLISAVSLIGRAAKAGEVPARDPSALPKSSISGGVV